jgi:hypothetical protein
MMRPGATGSAPRRAGAAPPRPRWNEAHGAHEVLPQLKSSVQVDPTPKPTPHQPIVPSNTASARAAIPGSATVQVAQSARATPDTASMDVIVPRTTATAQPGERASTTPDNGHKPGTTTEPSVRPQSGPSGNHCPTYQRVCSQGRYAGLHRSLHDEGSPALPGDEQALIDQDAHSLDHGGAADPMRRN